MEATFLMYVVRVVSFMFLLLEWMAKVGVSLLKALQVSEMAFVCREKPSLASLLFSRKCKSATLPERKICMC